MNQFWLLFFALLVGSIGSLAYVTVINFKLIGKSNAERQKLLEPFLGDDNKIHFGKLFWYCIIGGLIAVIFQYPESTFVSIQNFLLGVTWPSLILHHITGRMKDLTPAELDELGKSRVTKIDEYQAKGEVKNIWKLIKKK